MPADEPDPPRKFYDFKPREFERVNPPAEQSKPTTPPAKKAGAAPPASPISVQDHLHHANAGQPRPGAGPPPPAAENDVHDMLRANLAHANAAGLNQLKTLTPRPSRRRRDYLFLLLVGDGFFLSVAAIGHENPMLLVCGLGGAGMFTAAVTWVIWGLMDRY